MLHCIIAGSRSFADYELMKRKLDVILSNHADIEIVEGGARGADMLAARYAKERGLSLKEFPADWDRYGKSAGIIRNRQMFDYIAQFPDKACVLFWDGKSAGTKNDIDLAKEYKVPYRLIRF